MRRLLSLFVLICIFTFPAIAQETAELQLEADLAAKELHAILDGERIRTWTVAVGTDRHPTPVGEFTIRKMIWNPGWVPPPAGWARDATPKKPGDPDNPMRVVKIFFKQPDYYIHGTNRPETLGTAASHGCIRMSEDDVLELGKMLMEHGGEWRSASWFRRIFTRDTSSTVYLGKQIPIRVAKEIEDVEPTQEVREIPEIVVE